MSFVHAARITDLSNSLLQYSRMACGSPGHLSVARIASLQLPTVGSTGLTLGIPSRFQYTPTDGATIGSPHAPISITARCCDSILDVQSPTRHAPITLTSSACVSLQYIRRLGGEYSGRVSLNTATNGMSGLVRTTRRKMSKPLTCPAAPCDAPIQHTQPSGSESACCRPIGFPGSNSVKSTGRGMTRLVKLFTCSYFEAVNAELNTVMRDDLMTASCISLCGPSVMMSCSREIVGTWVWMGGNHVALRIIRVASLPRRSPQAKAGLACSIAIPAKSG